MEAGRQTEVVEIDRIALNRVVKEKEALRITPSHFTNRVYGNGHM